LPCGGCCCCLAEPTSLELYVDGLRVNNDDNNDNDNNTSSLLIEYENVTAVDIECVAVGGHPEPIVAVTTGTDHHVFEPSSINALCRLQPSDLPAFLPNLTCSTAVYVDRYRVDYSASHKQVTCSARSRGSPDVRLSASFTPYLPGGTFHRHTRRVIEVHHHHFICPIIQLCAYLHQYNLKEQDSKV